MELTDEIDILLPDALAMRTRSTNWVIDDVIGMITERAKIEERYHDALVAFSVRYQANHNILYPELSKVWLKIVDEARQRATNHQKLFDGLRDHDGFVKNGFQNSEKQKKQTQQYLNEYSGALRSYMSVYNQMFSIGSQLSELKQCQEKVWQSRTNVAEIDQESIKDQQFAQLKQEKASYQQQFKTQLALFNKSLKTEESEREDFRDNVAKYQTYFHNEELQKTDWILSKMMTFVEKLKAAHQPSSKPDEMAYQSIRDASNDLDDIVPEIMISQWEMKNSNKHVFPSDFQGFDKYFTAKSTSVADPNLKRNVEQATDAVTDAFKEHQSLSRYNSIPKFPERIIQPRKDATDTKESRPVCCHNHREPPKIELKRHVISDKFQLDDINSFDGDHAAHDNSLENIPLREIDNTRSVKLPKFLKEIDPIWLSSSSKHVSSTNSEHTRLSHKPKLAFGDLNDLEVCTYTGAQLRSIDIKFGEGCCVDNSGCPMKKPKLQLAKSDDAQKTWIETFDKTVRDAQTTQQHIGPSASANGTTNKAALGPTQKDCGKHLPQNSVTASPGIKHPGGHRRKLKDKFNLVGFAKNLFNHTSPPAQQAQAIHESHVASVMHFDPSPTKYAYEEAGTGDSPSPRKPCKIETPKPDAKGEDGVGIIAGTLQAQMEHGGMAPQPRCDEKPAADAKQQEIFRKSLSKFAMKTIRQLTQGTSLAHNVLERHLPR